MFILPIALRLRSLNHLRWIDEQGQEQDIRLVKKVSAKWYEFGMFLGTGLNELDAWRIQYQGDAGICWNKVMNEWLVKGGSHDYPATWEGLCILLNDLDFGNVARDLQKIVCPSRY